MKATKYVLHGRPVPLNRPRFARGRIYDSQKKLKERDQFYLRLYKPQLIVKRPVALEAVFYFKLPKRFKQTDMLHYCRPDLSNLIKYIEDMAMGILYNDDCIIARIRAEKRYDSEPRTEFMIFPIDSSDQYDSVLQL
jgi:Holliday junction resolvase RusA-like endonuclease